MNTEASLITNARLMGNGNDLNWVYCSDGKIVSIGPGNPPREYQSAVQINAEEQFLAPGFIDSHLHLHSIGWGLKNIDLAKCKSSAELLKKIQLIAQSGEKPFILGHSWDESKWSDPTLPTLEELNFACPNIPLLLNRIDQHSALVNTKALELLGPIAELTDPPGGKFARDPQGLPTSVVLEEAAWLVQSKFPEDTQEELHSQFLLGQEECLRHGITSAHDVAVSIDRWNNYLHAKATGDLRVFTNIAIRHTSDMWGQH